METPNLSYVNALSDGDESFKNELIQIIKLEFPREKSIYFKNLEMKNFKVTAECVHKLKHKISIFGLIKSYELANNYENDLLKKDLNLSGKFEVILDNISSYLNQI